MLLRPRFAQLIRRCSQTTGTAPSAKPSTPGGINANVQGLSSRCVKPTTESVGPGATTNGEYKVPEYFCFNRNSYYEAEIEMAKYRCPQPNANRK